MRKVSWKLGVEAEQCQVKDFWQEYFPSDTVYFPPYHAERHLMADCSTISDVDVDFDHLVKAVAARSLHCKGHFPKSPWLNSLICQHEALIGQYLPLAGIVYFQQIWLQGKIVQNKMVVSPTELPPEMGVSYREKDNHSRTVLIFEIFR